jgi:hypothetical protein
LYTISPLLIMISSGVSFLFDILCLDKLDIDIKYHVLSCTFSYVILLVILLFFYTHTLLSQSQIYTAAQVKCSQEIRKV